MAYDRELVERLHAVLAPEPSLEERRMFGGVGFMVEGALAVAAMSNGGLLARVGREAVPGLMGPGVDQMAMKGRPMTGWLSIAPERLEDDDELGMWVQRCLDCVRSLGRHSRGL